MTSRTTLPDPARVAEDQGIVIPCRDPRNNPDAWFAQANTPAGLAQSEAARNLCAYRCPLQAMCRDWALGKDEKHGIWGGLTESQRRTLREGKRIREPQGRWLAGQTDHDGNTLPAPDTAEDAPSESDDTEDLSRLVATPEALQILSQNSPQALRALLGRHKVAPAVRGSHSRHSQYRLGDLLQVKARKRRYTSPTTAA